MPDIGARHAGARPRSVALVGPYGSGKTALFEALLAAAGSPVGRPGEKAVRSSTTGIRVASCSLFGRSVDDPGLPRFGRILL